MDERILRMEQAGRVIDVGGTPGPPDREHCPPGSTLRLACDRYATAAIATSLATLAQLRAAEDEDEPHASSCCGRWSARMWIRAGSPASAPSPSCA